MNGWAGKMNKSPWAYEEPYRSINRDYLKLKMRLTPYIYKYAREAYDTGAPIVRGMLWNYPQDKKTWDRSTQHQYMLGDWLLVAPVYTSMKACKGWRREDIYLPAGRWIDYWDGRRVDGPMVIDDYPLTLEKLPVLVKAGAIIPMYPAMLYNNQKPKDPLTFAIYPYGESQFEMYEDDGLTRKHQAGEFARQMIKVSAPTGTAGDIQVTVGKSEGAYDGKLSQRVYQFEIHSELKPRGITVDGRPLLELTDPGAYEAAVSAWTFDPTNRRGIVYAKLPHLPTDKSVTLHLDIDEKQQIAACPPYPKPAISPVLEKLEFTVKANSQNRGSLKNAFDSSPDTFWQSNTSLMRPKDDVQKPPYIIDIALNGLYAVKGLQYLARQDLGKGLIKDVEVYVSRQEDKLGEPVYKGSFAAIKDLQTAKFPTKWGNFVRIKILNSFKDQSVATAAEFDLLQDLEIPPLPDEEVYLSDLEPAQKKGKYRKDLSVGGKPMVVNSRPHKKGLGVCAPSELVYKTDGTWDRLTGNVGVDDEVGDGGSVMFRVYADGKLIFESPRQSGKSVKQLMDLDIKGVKELRLSLLDGDDGNENDHGDWIDTRLIRRGSQR